ncbi:glyoxalase [Salegentibacter salinarum]|uniref:Glyoxalase n=1 Tax=Salegentibacter salinarum TaxID=447422 RepID=A0A2N0TR54_9FLAO|nr:VOC family protein [Salegentibacter salinarum]PKD17211.1 glyoxalase [Salegentibacter salinarum]SKB56467.1 PhnB protein [Salegentibacter salinarum]
MATLNPYLNFNGNTEEAFNFYKSVFKSDFSHIMRFTDMPPEEEGADKIPKEYENQILHVSLPIGDSVLMGSDCIEAFGQKAVFGSSNYISVTPTSEEETRRLFIELSADGEVEMPLEEMFWGDLFASFSDKFGIKWMLNYPIEK